ncbi:sensor histidine kinase [Chitinilyticum piscinae]|uniref:histidine kinase n=1 Tax=Chitinilyticum piscinae TaxID=2866724 RepID=A0A8J7FRS3_9NEIS|nr:HAMP domain-containing sensor histidine kinase [Chitinilyticum piscinae]MBE9609711.1 HAMP domain-containing histidine kinase [Chitinilyticum piscinae]
MNSIRQHLNILLVCVVTIVLAASGGYSYWRAERDLRNNMEQYSKALENRLKTVLPNLIWNFDDEQLAKVLDAEMSLSYVNAIVVYNNNLPLAGRIKRGDQITPLQGKPPVATSKSMEFPVFYAGNPQAIGKVTIELTDAPVQAALRQQIIERVIEIVLLVIILLIALSRSVTIAIMRPLDELRDKLNQAAEQKDNIQSIQESRYVEFADVMAGFNRIAERLMADITEKSHAAAEMRQAKESAETAYRQLKEAQSSLVQSEKMASLGNLVAGVAHEINTPVGVIVTSASVLVDETLQFRKALESNALKKSEVLQYSTVAEQSSNLILANAERAANLIQSFKRVAVDQTSEARRDFELNSYLNEIITSLRPTLKHTAIEVNCDCPEGIRMDSYPGALSQIITNFLTNAMAHAFEPGQSGHIRIAAEEEGPMVTLSFSDDGKGIASEHLSRIFDPFFTTKRGSGGSGLGLNIVYNLVTQTLGGTIFVNSQPGIGTSFVVCIPKAGPRDGGSDS